MVIDLDELLAVLNQLSDDELDAIARAAEFELLAREHCREEALKSVGAIPLYQCQNPDHWPYGLFAEDPDHKGLLTCGCPKQGAKLVSYE